MKSPLVDALRQANKSASASGRAESDRDERAVERSAAATVPEADELELMESASLLPGGRVPEAIAGDAARPGYGTAGLLGANDERSTDDVPGPHLASPPRQSAAAGTRGHSRIARLGLYSPLVCLALASAAAGAYVAFRSAGGWYHNSDLESLSSQSASGPGLANAFPARRAENPFALIVQPEAPVRGDPDPDAAAASSADRQAPPVPAEASARGGIDDPAIGALNDAFAAYERGDDAGAEAAYRRALALAPRHPNALQGLAAILQRTGRPHESLQHYETLLAVDPGNPVAAASLLAARAAPATAESDIKHLLQQYPESAPLRFALGVHLAGQSRWADARRAFDQAARLDAENADYLFNLAVSLDHLGRLAEARHVYASALDAASATSTLDRDVLVARLDELTQLPNPEGPVR